MLFAACMPQAMQARTHAFSRKRSPKAATNPPETVRRQTSLLTSEPGGQQNEEKTCSQTFHRPIPRVIPREMKIKPRLCIIKTRQMCAKGAVGRGPSLKVRRAVRSARS
ncbi:MAG: hypothetical protein CJBNEKGG_00244 [Prosthecobacter sp.]|nr:hypothetical protein [Prosthecobacter sp.]